MADRPILSLYSDYDRQAVQEIFEPGAAFTPGAGKWGISGAVEVPGEPGSFVFFVSFGRLQGENEFDEGISQSGVLRWQSQPAQELSDRRVRSWIDHNADLNTIHLFLRTTIRRDGSPTPFTYLGELDYGGHDPKRERPVHFSWRLQNWPIPVEVLDRIDLAPEGKEASKWDASNESRLQVNETWLLVPTTAPQIPANLPTEATGRRHFTPRLDINFEAKSARARKLGELGERLVVEAEKRRLIACGREDLAGQVVHVARERGDGAGYDVLSFSDNGGKLFIEVKTTTGGPQTDFLISANELAFSSEHSDQYRLYRLFHFDENAVTAQVYVIEGDLRSQLPLSPTEYRVSGLRSASAQ